MSLVMKRTTPLVQALLAAPLALVLAGGCSADSADRSTDTEQSVAARGALTGGLASVKNVFIVLMENHNWSSVKGSASAPYINGTLLPMGAHAENYVNLPGIHPSEPNYIWLEAGDNLGITNDNAPSTNHQATTAHLVTQLEAAGVTWKAYAEGITGSACPVSTSGLYAPKHVPFVYFDDVRTNASRCTSHVRPFSELAADLASGNVARYNFITPDLCDDMHNSTGCATSSSLANGDAWLSAHLPAIFGSSTYKQSGAVFVTWDESEGGDLPIGMLVISPFAKPGYSNTIAYNHSSTLRTFQEIFGTTPFLRAAATATDLSDLFLAGGADAGTDSGPADSGPADSGPADAGACAHPICSTGGALASTCDPCAKKICASDAFCCSSSWDKACVGEVASICGQSCTGADAGGTDAGGTDAGGADAGSCAHAVCSSGAKLAKTCDPCVTKVCAQDSFCCASSWDSTCVGEVASICGQTCN